MTPPDTNAADSAESRADTLALRALVWTLEEPRRAERLLSTTGLEPRALRSSAGAPSTLIALLGFLEAHEPDLIACAGDLGCTPQALVAARAALEARA